ncbi:MAG: cobalamin biosynthesis protein CobQ [Pseudomonadota bacterium]
MMTQTHVLVAAAAFAKPERPGLTWAAILGGLAPDASLYFLSIWHAYVLGVSWQVIFDELYFSSSWQLVFAVDNSVFLWGAVLGAGLLARRNWIVAFGGAALLHVALDFPLHHDDGRPHFWPISDWVFESPVSYWDTRHYGGIVRVLEGALALALCALLWRRFPGAWARVAITLGAAAIAAPPLIFLVFMGLGPA